MVKKRVHGIVHGKRIDLDEDLGIAEGQQVEVQVRILIVQTKHWGDGIRRAAGALVNDPHWDGIMQEIQQARKQERRPQLESE